MKLALPFLPAGPELPLDRRRAHKSAESADPCIPVAGK